ncbi:MAG: VCBS repeat-containing protein [Balneolaceae bacterium]
MDEQINSNSILTAKVKIFGTLFLAAQLLLAINNYGPHEIPVLSLVFDEPWIPAEVVTLQTTLTDNTDTFTFEDISEQAGLYSFKRAKVNAPNPSYLEVMGGGVAVADVDGDGYEDIFLISMSSFEDHSDEPVSQSTLFKNMGNGTFVDITAEAGLSEVKGMPQGALFFDFNNNGRQDLYIASYDGGQLFRNDGGTYTDVTDKAGLSLDGLCSNYPCFGSAASAADYNRNGHLDLYIVNNVDWDINNPAHYGERQLFPAFFKAQKSFLFENNGDGTFTEVTEKAGVSNDGGKGLSAVWFDFNNNGWPDLYIANDLTRNRLYLNRGDGTFIDVAASAGVNEVKSSMGVNTADFNNSGHPDLATTNLEGSYVSLFRNYGDLRFDYATHYSGLNPSRRSSGWGIEFADLNLNGYPDLVKAAGPVWDLNPTDAENLFFKNNGDGRFEDVTLSTGSFQNSDVSRGLAVIDVQNNGKPDLIISNIDGGHPQLLMNTTINENHWLKLTLEGTKSNRDAVGAKVTLERTDGLMITQEVRAGGSYQSTSTKSLFLGLADSGIEQVTIRWPAGHIQLLNDVTIDTTLHIKEEEKDSGDELFQ